MTPDVLSSDPFPLQVWDKATFTLKSTLQGHTGSVLALQYAPDRQWLFSASGELLLCLYLWLLFLIQFASGDSSVRVRPISFHLRVPFGLTPSTGVVNCHSHSSLPYNPTS